MWLRGATVLFVSVSSLFLLANNAEASIFSFLENLFSSKEPALQEASLFNSRNLSLLDAPINSNALAGQGGGDINIVQNSALLPVTGPLGSLADIEAESQKSGQISIYVVREGDTLSHIAKMFNVSVSTIIWANDITRGDLIRPGQTLVILPVTGVQYTIKNGDTIAGIAEKFKGDVSEIIQFNDLSDADALVVGKTIIIPNGEGPPIVRYTPRGARGTGGPNYVGYYLRPINGGRRSQGLHGYNGVDLANSCGLPVLASASGDVIISRPYGWNGGYGKYVVIAHPNGTQTLYAHLSSTIVSAGWHVVQGQVIGYIGSTGNSTGCHVHFEIRGARNPF